MESPLAYVFQPYRLVPAQRALLASGVPVRLGGRAFDALVCLVERRDRTVSKQELLDMVWPQLVVEQNNLQVQVLALRKLLGHAAIATVPGRGYRFTLPITIEGGHSSETPSPAVREPSSPRTTNLPHWMPALLGREQELQTLQSLVSLHDWVSVVGPAGIGKTRLAQAAARACQSRFPGGLWWVDLASLQDEDLIANAIALAMGIALTDGQDPSQAIAAAIPALPTLIALDNVEHLLRGVAQLLVRLRPAAGDLHLLITSQEILHASDEHVFRLEPMSLPANDTLSCVEASDAVVLFTARAQSSDRRFTLNSDNCVAVADICRRLDGLPLAIELAAARLPMLGLDGLRSRLHNRFNVLTSGDRTALRRHRTLREAIDWSYQLLSDPERTVFRRLGVFVGGFTIEAAQAVAEDSQEIDQWDALEHLGALVDKSLVVADGDPTPRYHMLETMRLFALERLIEQDEADAVRSAHRDHFVLVAEEASPKVRSANPLGLTVLDPERDNMLLALAWTKDDDDGLRGLRLAGAMRFYWTSRGMVTRGLEHLRAALAHPGVREASVPRFRAELAAAQFCCLTGRLDEGVIHGTRCVEVARALGDDGWLSLAHSSLGDVHNRRGDVTSGEECGMAAIAFARKSGDIGNLLRALTQMSAVHSLSGRYPSARELQLEAQSIARQLNDLRNQITGRLNLAWVSMQLRELEDARQQLLDALALFSKVDSEYHGVHLLLMAALWAAHARLSVSAITLEATYQFHSLRTGLQAIAEPADTAPLTRAREALAASAAEAATNAGRALSYSDALTLAEHVLQDPAEAEEKIHK